MKHSNGNLVVKMIHLLKEKRDGLILVDGKWGTGKTFFIKNKLPKYYSLNTFYYISLLGVKSLSDFKAKIIDCYYLQDLSTLKSGLDTLSGLGSIGSGSPASANVINGMFNSIGASVRENILSKLNGIFILDDIERINESVLSNEILTYCHSLYLTTTDSSVDFIIISNTSTESNLKINHKEKIISDLLHYNPMPQEILDMGLIENNLKNFPWDDRNLFEELVINNNIVNIRILMRVINISAPLYSHAVTHSNLSWRIPSTTILSSIFSFFILLFYYNEPIEKLIEDRTFHILGSSKESDYNEAKLWSALNNYKITQPLKQYYSGHFSLNDILDIVFHEPKPLSLVAIATSTRPEIHEVDEKSLYITIIDLISKKTPCDLHCWLRAVQNYEYLTFHKYLPKSSKLTLQFMNSKLIEFNDNEVITAFEQEGNHSFGSLAHGFDDGKLLYRILSCRHEIIIKKRELHSVKEMLESDGWATFNVELLSKIDPIGNYKVLEVLGSPFLTKCILKIWSVKDIEQFNAFLKSNYRISNIAQFASEEKKHLIYLSQKLDIFCLSRKEGFKFGAIYDLNKTLKHAISCL